MRTWWIVKDHFGLRIVEGEEWNELCRDAIGPYWSHEEAMGMLHFWMK